MSYDKETNKQYLLNRYYEQRAEFIAYLGGVCMVCGTTLNLQFDHVEPKLKSFSIGKLWSKKDLPKVYIELDKCQLLCEEHHKAKTKADHANGFIYHPAIKHGTMYAWMKKKCECEECQTAKRIWHDTRNSKRRRESSKGPYNQPAEHGTRKCYSRGCRCLDCKAANAAAERERRANKK